jgi:hypothetical protein
MSGTGSQIEDADAFRAFAKSHRWIFAKTMPENPHEYTLRRDTSGEHFEAAVRFIRARGETELYEGRPYVVYRCDDHKYWTMGAPVEETVLINRKLLPHAGGPAV